MGKALGGRVGREDTQRQKDTDGKQGSWQRCEDRLTDEWRETNTGTRRKLARESQRDKGKEKEERDTSYPKKGRHQ